VPLSETAGEPSGKAAAS